MVLPFCYLHSTSCSFLFNFFASPPLDLIPLDSDSDMGMMGGMPGGMGGGMPSMPSGGGMPSGMGGGPGGF